MTRYDTIKTIAADELLLTAKEVVRAKRRRRKRDARTHGLWRCVPGEEEWLVEVVVNIDDEVVVGDGVYLRPRELAIDQYPLQHPHFIHHVFTAR